MSTGKHMHGREGGRNMGGLGMGCVCTRSPLVMLTSALVVPDMLATHRKPESGWHGAWPIALHHAADTRAAEFRQRPVVFGDAVLTGGGEGARACYSLWRSKTRRERYLE